MNIRIEGNHSILTHFGDKNPIPQKIRVFVTTQVIWNPIKIYFILPQKPQIKFLLSFARRNFRKLRLSQKTNL